MRKPKISLPARSAANPANGPKAGPRAARRSLSRRSLFRTAAAGGAVAAAVSILPGCSSEEDEEDEEPTVVDEDSAESVLDSFEASSDLAPEVESTWTLPLGSVLHPAEGSWIPVTSAGSSASPMVRGAALSLDSGQLYEVVSAPLGQASTTVIYDVRCSDEVYAWVELDMVSRDWALYAAEFSEGQLTGDTKTLWEGTSDYDPAPFDVTGSSVIWQVQPSTSGSKTTESSYCYLWHAGDSAAKAVVESPGRFATRPTISGDVVVLVPRVTREESGTYYAVTAYSLSDDLSTRVDRLVMPASVRPFRATRVGDRFLVSVEASYSSGGLLGQMGTYMGTSSSGFVRLGQEPSECGCGLGDTFIVKCNSYYYVMDLAEKTYSTISSVDRSVDYGEFPARSGECDLFVTFSTVKDADTGYPASVTVRTFRLQS